LTLKPNQNMKYIIEKNNTKASAYAYVYPRHSDFKFFLYTEE